MKKTVFALFVIFVLNIFSAEVKKDFRTDINQKTEVQREKIKKEKGLTNVFVWEDKKDNSKFFYLTEKRYWIKAKRNYGYGHIADYVAQYRYGIVTAEGKELITPVLKGVSVLYNGKAKIKTAEDTGWIYIDGSVKWDSKNSAVEDAEKNIKLTMISDEEKEKHYKKVNVFRVVDIPKTYDMEIIRGDKMQKDGGYRTGIYVEGKEKIVSKVPDFNGNYEFSAIFSRDYFK